MPDEHGNETTEEALERLAHVSSTQIFGDNITTVVIAAEAESELVEIRKEAAAEPEAEAEVEPEVEPEPESEPEVESESEPVTGVEEAELRAVDKVERIKAATSVEEVDALAANDSRVTVERAADEKREEFADADDEDEDDQNFTQ